MNFPWNKDAPLGLPEGSVRAIFAGSIIMTFCVVIVIGFVVSGQFPVLPDWFTETFFGALAYYGVTRHGAPVANALASKIRQSSESTTESEMKAELIELRSKQLLAAMQKADELIAEVRKKSVGPNTTTTPATT